MASTVRRQAAGEAERRRKPQPLPRLHEGKRRTLPADVVLPPERWPGFWADEDKHVVVAAV